MIPSTIAAEVSGALEDFLSTGFGPSNPALSNVVTDFLADTDNLLTRPVDFPLWRHNAASVLRYLIVDELHTFDGAQGTDLACLIRRLRARLQADDGLVCAGTSATIGGEEDRPAILDYVSDVFHQPFSPDAVVGEVRQGIDEFLRDAIISSYLVPQPGLAERMDPGRYPSAEEYIRAQHELFFGIRRPGGSIRRSGALPLARSCANTLPS